MTIKEKKGFKLSLLLVPLVLLPGCWPFDQTKQEIESVQGTKTVEDGSPVLMKMNGRPVITLDSFTRLFDRLLQKNPQLQQFFAFMPNIRLDFLKGMVSQFVIDEYIHQNNIDSDPEYQKELEETIEQVRQMLNMNYFSNRHPVDVSEAEIRKFYDENKDRIPDLMQSQGGVKAEGVSFADEEEAKAFLAKAKEAKSGDFEKLASDAGFANNYQDFKLVNVHSIQIDPTLKAKISKITSTPTLELFNVNDQWWVVKAHSKSEPLYVPFESVKPSLEEHLKKQKQAEVFEKVIDKYKTEYNVEINDVPLKAESPAEDTQLSEEHAAAEDIQPVMRTV